ncbi:MAG TPA: hypothetical protein DD671_09960, partial [Balneolaceae bacterium]|nr:hypothetical protein [Balneolaceae bacterium]
MEITLNIYSIVLFFVGSIAGLISTLLFFRSGRAIRSFSFLMLGITIWCLAYAFELASSSLSLMLFWINIEYIGIALMPGFWLLFCIQFTGYDSLLTKNRIFLIFLLPAITLLLVWTNDFHQLHYAATTIVEVQGLSLLKLETGIWYIIHTIIFYSYLLTGIGFLLKKYANTNHLIRKQISMILLGASVPWIANATYLLGYRPLQYIDATPYAFAITGIFISAGLVWYKLFEVLPVAREKIIEQTKDGIIILNNDFQILDLNAAAIQIIHKVFDGTVIGELATDIFRDEDEVLNLLNYSEQSSSEWSIHAKNKQKHFEISINPFLNNLGAQSGYFMVFKD